jgi:hypothetical protein
MFNILLTIVTIILVIEGIYLAINICFSIAYRNKLDNTIDKELIRFYNFKKNDYKNEAISSICLTTIGIVFMFFIYFAFGYVLIFLK